MSKLSLTFEGFKQQAYYLENKKCQRKTLFSFQESQKILLMRKKT